MWLPVWHTDGMPRSSSRDLRERLLQARSAGLSATEIERTTGVSADSVRRRTLARPWAIARATTPDRVRPGRPAPVPGRRPFRCHACRARCPLGGGDDGYGQPRHDVPGAAATVSFASNKTVAQRLLPPD